MKSLLFLITLLPLAIILFYVSNNNAYAPQDLNISKSTNNTESKVIVTQVCKKYSDIKMEWCEMDLNDDNSPLIIIGNNTITTISKLKWNNGTNNDK